jgi:hypothetical protein
VAAFKRACSPAQARARWPSETHPDRGTVSNQELGTGSQGTVAAAAGGGGGGAVEERGSHGRPQATCLAANGGVGENPAQGSGAMGFLETVA